MPTTDGAHAESGAAPTLTALTPEDADGQYTVHPYGEFDAKVWALEFVRRFGGDEELMLEWFANAIMTGFDRGVASQEGELASAREALRVAAAERERLVAIIAEWKSKPSHPYGYDSLYATCARQIETALAPLAPQPAVAPDGEALTCRFCGGPLSRCRECLTDVNAARRRAEGRDGDAMSETRHPIQDMIDDLITFADGPQTSTARRQEALRIARGLQAYANAGRAETGAGSGVAHDPDGDVWHYSAAPGRPLCQQWGPNEGLTDTRERVTCLDCKKAMPPARETPPAVPATGHGAAPDLRVLLAAYHEACERPSGSSDYAFRMSEAFGAWMQEVTDRLAPSGEGDAP